MCKEPCCQTGAFARGFEQARSMLLPKLAEIGWSPLETDVRLRTFAQCGSNVSHARTHALAVVRARAHAHVCKCTCQRARVLLQPHAGSYSRAKQPRAHEAMPVRKRCLANPHAPPGDVAWRLVWSFRQACIRLVSSGASDAQAARRAHQHPLFILR
eukprot:4661249-Pleurochrysis_carterae.AAC.3